MGACEVVLSTVYRRWEHLEGTERPSQDAWKLGVILWSSGILLWVLEIRTVL